MRLQEVWQQQSKGWKKIKKDTWKYAFIVIYAIRGLGPHSGGKDVPVKKIIIVYIDKI